MLIKAKLGAVAAEEIHCSEIGVEGNEQFVFRRIKRMNSGVAMYQVQA